jgi:hypothetical protein
MTSYKKGPSQTLVKELQALAAFHIHIRSGYHETGSQQKAAIEAHMYTLYEVFHGNASKGIASQAKLLYQSASVYSGL